VACKWPFQAASSDDRNRRNRKIIIALLLGAFNLTFVTAEKVIESARRYTE
jgi:hypothetical protein